MGPNPMRLHPYKKEKKIGHKGRCAQREDDVERDARRMLCEDKGRDWSDTRKLPESRRES